MAVDSEETKAALEELTAYDVTSIPPRDVLGKAFDFSDAVPDVQRIQSFFARIPTEYISDLSQNFVQQVYNQTLAVLNVLKQIQSFDPQADQNPATTRDNILASLGGMYDSVFNSLHPAVSFIAARQRDFSSLELEARAAKESATRQAAELQTAMEGNQKEADRILGEIRKVAAEQGVSQQAAYFKEEAEDHDKLAKDWEGYTVKVAIGLGIYAVITALVAVLYTPENPYQAVQLGLSKVLIFAVIAYMLFHCARTTLAHRDNAVVNHHRENALLTFNALASAAGEDESRDIILTHAASCIFSPQDSGYSKQNTSQGSAVQVIEALPRLAHAVGQSA